MRQACTERRSNRAENVQTDATGGTQCAQACATAYAHGFAARLQSLLQPQRRISEALASRRCSHERRNCRLITSLLVFLLLRQHSYESAWKLRFLLRSSFLSLASASCCISSRCCRVWAHTVHGAAVVALRPAVERSESDERADRKPNSSDWRQAHRARHRRVARSQREATTSD